MAAPAIAKADEGGLFYGMRRDRYCGQSQPEKVGVGRCTGLPYRVASARGMLVYMTPELVRWVILSVYSRPVRVIISSNSANNGAGHMTPSWAASVARSRMYRALIGRFLSKGVCGSRRL